MQWRRILKCGLCCALLHFCWGPDGSRACDIPVFRYALEQDSWHPSPYPILLFHQGELDRQAAASLKLLKAAGTLYMEYWDSTNRFADVKYPANVDVLAVDIGGKMDDEVKAVWTRLKPAALPVLAVCLPVLPGDEGLQCIWTCDASVESARRILDSPVRRQVLQGIAGGSAAAWIFVESEDASRNEKAFKQVQQGLGTFTNAFEFPPQAIMAMGLETEEELQISFSLIRMSRRDPAEKLLMSVLNWGEQRKTKAVDEPIVLPVLGRGRAFWALAGDEITEENIWAACSYITGGCSCEIKWQNPGLDLLMSADWYKILGGAPPPPLPDSEASGGAPPLNDAPDVSEPASTESRTVRNLLLTGGFLLLVVVAVSVVLHRKLRSRGG